MIKQEVDGAVDASGRLPPPVLSIEEVRQLEIVQIKSVREGEEPSYSYNFCPSIRNVPKDFFVMADISWVPCDESRMSRTMRNWVQHLRDEGNRVEVSSAPGGIMCFHLNFRGERISLWFNAWTSTAIVVGSNGQVRKPLFAEESTIA